MKDFKGTTRAVSRALCAGWLVLAAAVPALAADRIAATDTTWRVTATGPGAGWNSSTSFDDTAWQAATVLYDVATYSGPTFAGTYGIWTQAGQYSSTDTTIWGRTEFSLAALPQSAILDYGFDDDGDIFVNGTQVASNHDGVAGNGMVDITAYLVAGANVVAFTVSDNYPVWGYNHAAWMRIEGTVAAVPEPSTYAGLLLGLGVIGLMRGRLRRSDRR